MDDMKRKLVSLLLSLSLMVVSVTGCQSDSVTEETKPGVIVIQGN